jgi:hypothetical protein
MPRFSKCVCAVMLPVMWVLAGCREQNRKQPEEGQPTGYSFAQGYPVSCCGDCG